MTLPTAKSRRLLLVEDNPDDQQLARIANRQLETPFDLDVADDGQDALQKLGDLGVTAEGFASEAVPVVLLVDLSMPRVDGLTFLRRLRQMPLVGHLPVIIFTTSTAPADVSACYAAGCNSYVVKPMDIASLRSTLTTIDRYWYGCNRPPVPLAG